MQSFSNEQSPNGDIRLLYKIGYTAQGLCCEDGVRHSGMTDATRNSSDTSPELFEML
ncbi:hypothetical protein OROHE_020789 [Orobanche hederae]